MLRVGASRQHKTIQSAVNAARNGDVVLVDAGTYPRFDVIGKGISILSALPNVPFTVDPMARMFAVSVVDKGDAW